MSTDSLTDPCRATHIGLSTDAKCRSPNTINAVTAQPDCPSLQSLLDAECVDPQRDREHDRGRPRRHHLREVDVAALRRESAHLRDECEGDGDVEPDADPMRKRNATKLSTFGARPAAAAANTSRTRSRIIMRLAPDAIGQPTTDETAISAPTSTDALTNGRLSSPQFPPREVEVLADLLCAQAETAEILAIDEDAAQRHGQHEARAPRGESARVDQAR